MAHFRGTVNGGGSTVSRLGHKSRGLLVEACSWQGKVTVALVHDSKTGKDLAMVMLERHNGEGTSRLLYHGEVGGD